MEMEKNKQNRYGFDFTPIGLDIKTFREAQKITREKLAETLDISPRHLQEIELEVILSRLVDTFSSRILYPMLLFSGNHSIAVV